MRRQNIECGQLLNRFRVVKCHAVCDATTTVMTRDAKFIETKVCHYVNMILSHSTKGIICVVVCSTRFAAVSITPKIRNHYCKGFGQTWGNKVPVNMGQGVAVQEENRWAISPIAKVNSNFRVSRLDLCLVKVFKHFLVSNKSILDRLKSRF